MGISIDEINVETCGPISELQLALGPFNLIYGRNELGKTFLVEFVARALFKNLAGWTLRDSKGRGTVVVSGLTQQPLSLTPSSRKKLEDYMGEDRAGLPTRINRLLVVKGADLSFEEGKSPGISKEVLKEYLSGQGVLDDIEKHITATVQGAELVNGGIEGKQMGEIKRRNNYAENLEQIDDLFEEIESIYSGGERQMLEDEVRQLRAQVEELAAAKRHYAYRIYRQIQKYDEQLSQIPEGQLEAARDHYRDLERARERIERHERRLEELEQESEHYEWLEQAITWYEQRGTQATGQSNTLYLLAIVFFLLLAIISSLFGFSAGTIFSIVAAAVVGWLLWRRQKAALAKAVDTDEARRLKAEYENRFDERWTGLPQMKAKRMTIEEAYHGARAQRKSIADEKSTLGDLRATLAADLKGLTGEKVTADLWEETIQELQDRRQRLTQEINDLDRGLVALGVPQEEYRSQPASTDYDHKKLQEFEEQLNKAEKELNAKTAELDTLKQRVSAVTRDDISTEWETLIENLQKRREDVAEDYRAVTAEILAGILISNVLDEVRAQEEEQIRNRLASPLVGEPIRQITGSYSGVLYEEGRVWVKDAYGRFEVSDLSTGAREQVLLGLRLGFGAQILRQERLFLILDDAFQHADWQRRERLLELVVNLAKDGWQITYFTMDDHIRELFDAAGREHFPDGYQYHELDA